MWTIPPEFVRVALTFSPCWGYPRCFNYGYSFFRKANVFCEESAKWWTSKSIFLHMGCNICGCWGRCSRYILKVSRVGASVNIPWLFKPEWYNQDTICIISLNFFQDFWNGWKLWEGIEYQGVAVNGQLMDTRSFRNWLIKIASMKLMVYIACR